MQNLSVSQAQKQFTSILSKTTVIIDKKSHVKKAVILPYATYEKLVEMSKKKTRTDLNTFVGILSSNLEIDDHRYKEIID